MKGETVALLFMGGIVIAGGVYLITRPKPQPVQQSSQPNVTGVVGSLVSGVVGLVGLL